MSKRQYFVALAALVALGISQNAKAALKTWNGTSVTPGTTNDLSVAGNWSPGKPSAATDDADFEDNTAKTIVVSGTVAARQWTFNTLGWNISGPGTVQLNNNGQIKIFGSGDDVTISANVNLAGSTGSFITGGGSININSALASTASTRLNLGLNSLGSGGQINLTGGVASGMTSPSLFLIGKETVSLGSSSTWANNFTIGGNNTAVGDLVINASDSLGIAGTAASGWTDITGSSGALVLNNITGGSVGEYVTPRFRAGADSSSAQIRSLAGNNTFSGTVATETGGVAGATNLTIESVANTLTFDGSSQIVQNLTGTNTLNLIGDGNGVIRSTITQAAADTVWGVTKGGGGTWTISGIQNYTGPTAVNGGKLIMNATHTGGGNYTIANLATLAGTGTTTSTITGGTGTIAPGDVGTIGALTVSNPAAAAVAVATLAVDFNSTLGTTDLLNDLGPIDFSTASLSFTDLGPVAPGTPTIPLVFANYTSETGTPTYTAPAGYSVLIGPTSASLVPSSVPEPASLGLLGMGALAMVRRRRSK